MPCKKHMERTKILVVEDDEDCRRILVLWLRQLREVTISEATNGQEALDCIAHDQPDILFLDLNLPVVDGLEVVRRLRTMPAPLSQVPVVAVTAYVLTWDEQRAIAAGCDEYMTKPIVNPGEIREKFERLLTHGRPPSSARSAW